MTSRSLNIVRRVLEAAGPGHPADAVLRDEVRHADLAPNAAAEVSRAVFAHERWRGWLDDQAPFVQRIDRALELAAQFDQAPQTFSDKELVARAVPPWVSEEMKIEAAWVRAIQREPKVWLRARPGQGGALSQKLGDCEAFGDNAPLSDILSYRGRQNLFRTPELHAGEFEVQDISSQAVSVVCDPAPGQTWWDACAGEGGKLLHLSDVMRNRGLIWASDRAAWRLQKLKRRAARARVFNYRSALWDGGVKLPTRTKFDGVLFDAPCSGIGTWQRNPHARWTSSPQDVRELAQLQKDLLAHAAVAVKPGGKLVYSVCTLTRSETEQVVENFSEQFADFKPLALRNPLKPASPDSVATAPLGNTLWLWPQDHAGNGMFIAAWRRG
jgi:16S rRNA (cytosine967-C5)-methyltransferase